MEKRREGKGNKWQTGINSDSVGSERGGREGKIGRLIPRKQSPIITGGLYIRAERLSCTWDGVLICTFT